jgi:hypothetical protein
VTSSTPVYGLEYPNALDEPCNFPEDWCEFTADVDAVLARFELGASRVLPAIPIAKVQVTEQVVVPELVAVPFDTVSIDTAGWTNFDVNNQVISIPRTARYTVCATATVATQGVVNSTWTLQVNGGTFQFVEALDRNANDVAISAQATGTISAGAEVALFMLAGTSLPNGYTLRSASLAVYWHADTERAS